MFSTNTPIDAGNLGDPLVDLHSRLLGMNTAVRPDVEGAREGLVRELWPGPSESLGVPGSRATSELHKSKTTRCQVAA